nr:hypothetical protein CFP56_73207 [Quercus suber]
MNGSSATFSQSMGGNFSSQPVLASSMAGRKRSRGDITAPDDDDEDAFGTASTGQQFHDSTGQFPSGDSKMTSADASAESMTERRIVTPADEGGERRNVPMSHLQRPSVLSRKSQRTNIGASSHDDLAQLVLPSSMREATSEPLIDEATRVLGISWARMDSSEALRINQAAYQKWIQKYYPSLKDVNIWFENSAIPGYLVCAVNSYHEQQTWYIFSNDLTEARIVTTEASQLVPRLQMLPALHLAAPGGQIHAETDPAVTSQSAIGVDQAQAAMDSVLRGSDQDHVRLPDDASQTHEPMCKSPSRHMELD